MTEGGRILADHCECMAGLGDSCLHVASLLCTIGLGQDASESFTVTQKSACWILPLAVKIVLYAPSKYIENHHLTIVVLVQDFVESLQEARSRVSIACKL